MTDEQNIENDEVDEVFFKLKDEILQKRINEELNKEKTSQKPYYCKICGKKIMDYLYIKKCQHCEISLCSACKTEGFCIHCWLNMGDDSRKTIKLFKVLSYSIPLLLILLLIPAIFQILTTNSYRKLFQFFIAELCMITLLVGLYYFSRWYIARHSKYFNPKWEKIIINDQYQQIINPSKSKRYIPDQFIRDYEKSRQKSIQNLRNWIEPQTDYKDVPIPAYINEDFSKKQENIQFQSQQIQNKIKESKESQIKVQYQLINKNCPQCGEIIQFADFCPECNVKYCPQCSQSNHPYNRICICGFIFPDLKTEFKRWIQSNKEE